MPISVDGLLIGKSGNGDTNRRYHSETLLETTFGSVQDSLLTVTRIRQYLK
jgi:hypothetical protein